jgi:anti-sigma regulatory factor (Ser/Thr protein kinase)
MTTDNRPLFTDGLTLAALPTAVGCARMLVRFDLGQWGVRAVMDEAELVVSELVTNAVKTTGVMDTEPRWTELTDLALLKVRLVLTQSSLFIEVWDRDPTLPVLKEPTLDAESGRGLFIVEATCRRWDVFHPRSGGKVVWGELPIPHGTFTPTGLPKRHPAPGPRRPSEVMQDPELLRRVRDGLNKL